MAAWGGLINSCEKKRSKIERRKGKIYSYDREIKIITRKDKRAFLSDQYKETEENKRMGKTRELFKKIPREHFMQRWAQ